MPDIQEEAHNEEDAPPPPPPPPPQPQPLLNLPPPACLKSTTDCEEWKLFKSMFENYSVIQQLDKQTKEYRHAVFMHSVGPKGIQLYNGLNFAEGEDPKDVSLIIKKFDEVIIGLVNVIYERYVFNNRCQEEGESLDSYVNALRKLAKSCKFCNCMHNDLIRDRLVVGIRDANTRKVLLQTRKLDLAKAIDICRGAEATLSQLSAMRVSSEKVSRLQTKRHAKHKSKPPSKPASSAKERECIYCGNVHIMKKEKCPAWGKKCSKCGGKNHFSGKCKSRKAVHQLQSNTDSDTDSSCSEAERVIAISTTETVNATSTSSKAKKEVHAKMTVHRQPVTFQVDCGATTNIIPARYLKNEQLSHTTKVLKMWNGTEVKPLGECFVRMRNPRNGKKYEVLCIVVDQDLNPILGKKASEQMGLITVHYDQFECVNAVSNFMQAYADVFDDTKLGTLPGKVTLVVKEGAQPVALPHRRHPVATRDALKVELDKLVTLGVIAPVEEPTDWVSQMTIQTKKSGEWRICIDPRPLNQALKREQYQLPILDEILPELAQARIFSKVDLSRGFWHLALDHKSSLLTTFATPFGRMRWRKLPFGLNISSELFQKRLHQALDGLVGVVCVADDIVVYGSDSSEHDARLKSLLERCRQLGIKLNKDKSEIARDSITFLGHQVTSQGLAADPGKVQAILEMPRPSSKEDVRVLQGTVGYLSRFLPHLSDAMEPLRQLTHEGVNFKWGDEQERALQAVKSLVTQSPILGYYNPKEELVLQADASNKGLGAALLQKGRPIAYKSRALTQAETRYASIEKEMLAVTWGLEKFHQYTYGRHVTVYSDHRPLEAISRKPLSRAPRRLQALLMRADAYDYAIVWQKGSDQQIADMLSRSCLPQSGGQEDIENINMCSFLPMRPEKIERLRKETATDEVLSTLKMVIIDGWPEDKIKLPAILTPFYSYADELTVQDGIIFKGERVVVPSSLRAEMKRDIHESHLGINGCTSRARESLFWPGMSSEIKQYISTCETCRKFERSNQKETLMPHNSPDRPWEKVGIDLFQVEGVEYLVTVDYFSNFWEIDRLENMKTSTIIKKLKAHFAHYGIPSILVSDNAPNLTSDKFQEFTQQWDIQHLTSAPHHPQANGMAESACKTAAAIMRKCNDAGGDQFLAILDHRNTPSQGMESSPAQRFFDRRTRTLLPTTTSLLQPKSKDLKMERRKLKNKQAKQAEQYNKSAKDLKVLEEGDIVRMKPYALGDRVWKKAVVAKRLDERSYEIQADDGNLYRRNRQQLKKTNEPHPSCSSEKQPTPSEAAITAQRPTQVLMGQDQSKPETRPKPVADPATSPSKSQTQQAKTDRKTAMPSASPAKIITRSGRTVKTPSRFTGFVRK